MEIINNAELKSYNRKKLQHRNRDSYMPLQLVHRCYTTYNIADKVPTE